MAELKKTEKDHENEMDLLEEPNELVEEDLESVAGGGCGSGKGCCGGPEEV